MRAYIGFICFGTGNGDWLLRSL